MHFNIAKIFATNGSPDHTESDNSKGDLVTNSLTPSLLLHLLTFGQKFEKVENEDNSKNVISVSN